MNFLKITKEIMDIYNKPTRYNDPYSSKPIFNYNEVSYTYNNNYYKAMNNYYKEKIMKFLYKQV